MPSTSDRRRGAAPAAVVFDLDGLLLDTEAVWTEAEGRLFARYGREFGDDEKRRLIGTSGARAAQILEELLDAPGEGPALSTAIRDFVWDLLEDGAHVRPGALDLLAALSERATPIGVASNSPHAIVERALSFSKVETTFGVVLGGDDVASPKPAPDVYLAACGALCADPAESVALEDSPTGVAAARAAGMRVLGVPSFPGVTLDEAHVVAASLAEPSILAEVGLAGR